VVAEELLELEAVVLLETLPEELLWEEPELT
jgi:hypothetical protein